MIVGFFGSGVYLCFSDYIQCVDLSSARKVFHRHHPMSGILSARDDAHRSRDGSDFLLNGHHLGMNPLFQGLSVIGLMFKIPRKECVICVSRFLDGPDKMEASVLRIEKRMGRSFV